MHRQLVPKSDSRRICMGIGMEEKIMNEFRKTRDEIKKKIEEFINNFKAD